MLVSVIVCNCLLIASDTLESAWELSESRRNEDAAEFATTDVSSISDLTFEIHAIASGRKIAMFESYLNVFDHTGLTGSPITQPFDTDCAAAI